MSFSTSWELGFSPTARQGGDRFPGVRLARAPARDAGAWDRLVTEGQNRMREVRPMVRMCRVSEVTAGKLALYFGSGLNP